MARGGGLVFGPLNCQPPPYSPKKSPGNLKKAAALKEEGGKGTRKSSSSSDVPFATPWIWEVVANKKRCSKKCPKVPFLFQGPPPISRPPPSPPPLVVDGYLILRSGEGIPKIRPKRREGRSPGKGISSPTKWGEEVGGGGRGIPLFSVPPPLPPTISPCNLRYR